MKYHAPTDSFVVDVSSVKHAALLLRIVMKDVRELGGFPLEPHSRQVQMTKACHIEYSLLELAEKIGVDLGGSRPGQVDLREAP